MALRALLVVLCLVCLGGAKARAQPGEIERRARELLSLGVETGPSPRALSALGPELPRALMAIYARASEARHVRLRALSVLSQLREPSVDTFFVRLLREGVSGARAPSDALHPARSSLALRRVIEALHRRQISGLELDLSRALSHRDAHVRRAAVLGLHRLGSEEAKRALSRQLEVETSRFVRTAITDRPAPHPSPRPNVPESARPPR